ncbi:DUF2637 domain-containing protein [Rhodococcus rhodnii]|uniref:DUF2637 domain-containing protein n=2 Tax=Rhodococcus rhodnii TaxID=38312 RepID=R7WK55_9NOCA|nr:DUF2637 domain-containing protein [Rhodococcus rhodnii]EOM74364.1 hypothetical protein Rrhod_4165 [Rhodococcus rhodnii LMG 5362]TXG88275.1 DUF2637 domain-containing protein [Rhodococcus rhodnii]TXG89087.1 DUF2637 domain-containing protein [Rhodococcus rhodnii]
MSAAPSGGARFGRRLDIAAPYAIAAIGFILSYSKLAELAERAGYGTVTAHLWPLAVDGLAIVATRGVLTLSTPSAHRYAWVMLGAGTSVSVIAAITAGMLPPGPLPPAATAAVYVVPPLCLLVAPHLAVKMHDQARRDSESADVAPTRTEPATSRRATPPAAVAHTATDISPATPDVAAAKPEAECDTVPIPVVAPATPKLTSIPNAQVTNGATAATEETRQRVISMKTANPALSFRAIARACDTSDKNVGRWWKAHQESQRDKVA